MAKRPVPAPVHEHLGEMLRAQPFVPFDIKTADGDTIHIVHPDFVARSPDGRSAMAYESDGHPRLVNLQMVVTIEPRKQPTKKKAKR